MSHAYLASLGAVSLPTAAVIQRNPRVWGRRVRRGARVACILVPVALYTKHPSIMPAVSLTIDKALGLDATAVAKVAHDAVKNGIGKPDMCEPLPRLPPLSHALISLAHASP